MNARNLRGCLLAGAALCIVLFTALSAQGATIQFLTPGGSAAGIAFGVDGLNVVGRDAFQRGFLYNGATNKYTVIQPGAGNSSANGIDGDKIVGGWGKIGFLYDGVSYTTLSHPLGTLDTTPWDIDGGKIVGYYVDASSVAHGFLFDGTTWSTLDFPGAKATQAYGISGNNIVGSYTDSKNRSHGFVYDGTTWTTLDDPLFPAAGMTSLHGIDGKNIVGFTISTPVSAAFLYDGISFAHPFGIQAPLAGNHVFWGISGNRIVGEYNNKPFVYVIPEPSSIVLASLAAGSLFFVRRRRARASPRLQ